MQLFKHINNQSCNYILETFKKNSIQIHLDATLKIIQYFWTLESSLAPTLSIAVSVWKAIQWSQYIWRTACLACNYEKRCQVFNGHEFNCKCFFWILSRLQPCFAIQYTFFFFYTLFLFCSVQIYILSFYHSWLIMFRL